MLRGMCAGGAGHLARRGVCSLDRNCTVNGKNLQGSALSISSISRTCAGRTAEGQFCQSMCTAGVCRSEVSTIYAVSYTDLMPAFWRGAAMR